MPVEDFLTEVTSRYLLPVPLAKMCFLVINQKFPAFNSSVYLGTDLHQWKTADFELFSGLDMSDFTNRYYYNF